KKQEVAVQSSSASLVVSVKSFEPVKTPRGDKKTSPSIPNQGIAGVVEKTKVELIGSLAPEYPWRSRANNEEGAVEMVFLVNNQGQAFNIKVLKSSGFENLDIAAIEAIQKA